MALGAVIVLVVLVMAGLSFPRWLKTRASDQKQPAPPSTPAASQPANPTPTDNNNSTPANAAGSNATAPSPNANSSSPTSGETPGQQANDSGTAGSSAAGAPSGGNSAATSSDSSASGATVPSGAVAKGKTGKKQAKAKSAVAVTSTPASPGSSDQGSAVVNPASDASATPEAMQELEQDADQTSSRATAVSDSLDNMRRQLGSQGLSLRGDIASAQEMMKTNLDKAQQALQNHDTKNARRYLNIAQAQLEKIEKFLGR